LPHAGALQRLHVSTPGGLWKCFCYSFVRHQETCVVLRVVEGLRGPAGCSVCMQRVIGAGAGALQRLHVSTPGRFSFLARMFVTCNVCYL
jgi:hypothetical protein